MAKVEGPHSDVACAHQTDGINVIFDQKSPASSHTRSRSRSGSNKSSCSSVSNNGHRGRGSHRRRYRSSSSTSSSSRSRSSSHARSRSHPRCHRPSSRCRCDKHRRYGRGRYCRSPPRRHRGHSHSSGRSPSPDRHSQFSRSSSRQSRHKRTVSRFRSSRSPPRTQRSRPTSRRSPPSVSLSLDDQRELLNAAKSNAMKILGTEKLELPESVKPALLESESIWESVEPETRVRQDPEKTLSQDEEMDPDDAPSPKMSPKRKIISFSVNNSVAKPTMAAPSFAKVTARVDIYDSRKPYGHWVQVKSGRSSNTRKHTLAMLR